MSNQPAMSRDTVVGAITAFLFGLVVLLFARLLWTGAFDLFLIIMLVAAIVVAVIVISRQPRDNNVFFLVAAIVGGIIGFILSPIPDPTSIILGVSMFWLARSI